LISPSEMDRRKSPGQHSDTSNCCVEETDSVFGTSLIATRPVSCGQKVVVEEPFVLVSGLETASRMLPAGQKAITLGAYTHAFERLSDTDRNILEKFDSKGMVSDEERGTPATCGRF